MWIYSTDSVALVTDQRSWSMFNCSCSPGICQGLPPECPCVTRKCWVFSGKCFRRSGAQERSLWRFGFTAHSLKSELGWLSYCIRLFVSCRVSAWWTYSIFPNIFLNFVDLKKLRFLFFHKEVHEEGIGMPMTWITHYSSPILPGHVQLWLFPTYLQVAKTCVTAPCWSFSFILH